MNRFLYLVVDQDTSEQLAEYEIDANNAPYARYRAANLYRASHPHYADRDWHVDSLEL